MTAPTGHKTGHKTISLTTEMLDRLRRYVADGGNASELIERLLRAHFGMAIRPPLDKGHKWQPGESANPDGRAAKGWNAIAREVNRKR